MIIMTGHTGRIGSAIYADLRQAGHEIRGFSLPDNDLAGFPHWQTLDEPDVLINAAGTYGVIGPLESCTMAEWIKTIQTNLIGTVRVCRDYIHRMHVGGVVINFGGAGNVPLPNYSAYAASKSAVQRFTECLAEEVKDKGLRVYTLAPGFIAGPFHDATMKAGDKAGWVYEYTKEQLAKGGNPVENVVKTVRYLISPECRIKTGSLVRAQDNEAL
jgi:NAD(P)-dependent dehydrogenase (short-subunit alcohol dehydrogenase family)